MQLFNEGDTACLLLNYTVNEEPMSEGAYDELEFQINPQLYISSIKKLLSQGDIQWRTVTYEDDNGDEQTFTGYVVYLTQEDTFKMSGMFKYQLRVMVDGNVGSSSINELDIGTVLSRKVLTV